MQQRVRNRQETINQRFMSWGILCQVMRRRDLECHGDIFRAIAVISQLSINAGEKLFPCYYDDNPPWADENMYNSDDDDELEL